MSKRSFHVRDEYVLMDLEISLGEPVNNISAWSIDVFIKFLEEEILDRNSLGPTYQPNLTISCSGSPGLHLNEYIEDLSQDPRLNQMSKTFFAKHTGNDGGGDVGVVCRVVFNYVPRVDVSTPGVGTEIACWIQP